MTARRRAAGGVRAVAAVLGSVALGVGADPLVAQPSESGRDSARLRGAEQHVVVVVEEPDSTRGLLYRLRKDGEGWTRVGEPVPVVVGRSGVGAKREGDGRSPRGIFGLGSAFGYASAPPASVEWPYRGLEPGTVCVDDPTSSHYNRLVGPDPERPASWTSAEAMRRDLAHGDDLYEYGVVVRYNPEGTPGAGSCIFLHVWRDARHPTAGCTALPRPALLELLEWLRPAASPLLVQGSRSYLRDLHARGALPYPPPAPRP